VKDQKTANVVARQYKRRLDDKFVLFFPSFSFLLNQRQQPRTAGLFWERKMGERKI
jgi:hypothetical protein